MIFEILIFLTLTGLYGLYLILATGKEINRRIDSGEAKLM